MARNTEKSPARANGLRKSGYHHGNLKEALVSAARVLILEKGPHGFSLIEAARLAGVSPAAPYRHFKDREALLARWPGWLRQFFRQSGKGLARRTGPTAAFRRLGHAYLDFALTERAYYAAMFEAELPPDGDPAFHDAADRAYRTLSAVTDRLKGDDPAGQPVPPEAVFFHIWSLAHGAATLGRSGAAPALSRHRMLDLGVELYLKGLGVTP